MLDPQDFHYSFSSLLLQIQQEELVTRVALFSLMPFLLAFAFIFFIFYRQNRESQLRKTQLDLELRALRAQMNPHFMFNCLNSIYHTIQKGQNKEAGDYLMTFSYLMRRVLENSFDQWISLDEDIKMLSAYMDLEQLRISRPFTYSVVVDESLDQENTAVPMLLVQPFIENSIWHGFSSKDGGHITINIHARGRQLIYEILDNGVEGTGNSELHKENVGKRKSLGTALVREQLAAISELEKEKSHFTSESIMFSDGSYAGKKVQVFLPLRNVY
jgi:LytS/YehU family sensor histidine kinase